MSGWCMPHWRNRVAAHNQPFSAPCVILSGGETTVTVRGKGGVVATSSSCWRWQWR